MPPAGVAAAKPAPMLLLVPLATEPAAALPSVFAAAPVWTSIEVEASPDGEGRVGVSRHDASHQSDERNTHQQFLHCDTPFLVSATASTGAGDAAV